MFYKFLLEKFGFIGRLVIFSGICQILMPFIFRISSGYFNLDKYAGFAYPTIITPVIMFLIVVFYFKELRNFEFKNNKKEAIIFGFLGFVFFYFS